MKLKQYPKYKETDVDFLGNVPIDWNVNRLKLLLSTLQSGRRELEEETPFENGAFSLGGEHINWDGTLKLDNIRLVSKEFYDSMNQGKIKINDVLLVKDGATIGKTALVKKKEYDKMCVNEHVFLLRPNNKLIPRLLYYLVYSDCGFSQIKLTETGSAQGGVNSEFTSKVTFSVSNNLKEQTQIVDFLDKKTTDINDLLEKDRKLIELLTEKRIAMINHVITKGLNPKAKFKDSGIEWIGKIPEGWKVKRLKHLSCRIGDGMHTTPNYVDVSEIYFINGNNLNKGKITITENTGRIDEDEYTKFRISLNKDTILISINGTIGNLAFYNKEKVILGKSAAYIECPASLSKYFVYYLLQTDYIKNYFKSSYSGTTIENLSLETLRNTPLPFPNLVEQTQIAKYLDKATSMIDEATKKIENRIELLEEYKKSLIHNVVTGKVNV